MEFSFKKQSTEIVQETKYNSIFLFLFNGIILVNRGLDPQSRKLLLTKMNCEHRRVPLLNRRHVHLLHRRRCHFRSVPLRIEHAPLMVMPIVFVIRGTRALLGTTLLGARRRTVILLTADRSLLV
jgi:hypothetical protein